MEIPEDQPAQRAGLDSFRLMSTGRKQDWIDLFSEDCLFEDPVGVSPLDPAGQGHRKSDLAKFWDASIGLGKMTVECVKAKPRGKECAFLVDSTNEVPGLPPLEVEAIVIYRVNDEGKVWSVRAYWEYGGAVDSTLGT
ncbi:MAG: nuclear transport factor 2 family protein [bacterium]|nr:ketosteroid isomerase [Deltaproteobacteria bacterium]MCP4904835.1 nuclear transport factor 2 family protein [bacterium]